MTMIKLELTKRQFKHLENSLHLVALEMGAEEDYPQETWFYNKTTRKLHDTLVVKLFKARRDYIK